MKAAACTLGPRHTWAFVKNVSVGTMSITGRGSSAHFSLKGLYRCACGAQKRGAYNPNGADLRQLVNENGGAA